MLGKVKPLAVATQTRRSRQAPIVVIAAHLRKIRGELMPSVKARKPLIQSSQFLVSRLALALSVINCSWLELH